MYISNNREYSLKLIENQYFLVMIIMAFLRHNKLIEIERERDISNFRVSYIIVSIFFSIKNSRII